MRMTDATSCSSGPGARRKTRLAERYGVEWEGRGPWNDMLDLLVRHKSLRVYDGRPLEEGVLENAIAAAQSASTSSGMQAWSVVAVEEQERRNRLSALCASQRQVRECGSFLIWLADHDRIRRIAAARAREVSGLDYMECALIAIVDCTLAAQNAAVALEPMGAGVCYIGSIRDHPEEIAAELSLPPYMSPIFGMCVGYPPEILNTNVKPRLPQGAVLYRETVSVDRRVEDESVAAYDPILRAFRQRNGLSEEVWSELTLKRVQSRETLRDRDRYAEAMRNLGFPLK